MPELPEVEIIKLGLEKKIIGLKIQKIQVLSPKSFIGNPRLTEGQIVLKVWRKAKILGMDLGMSFWGAKRLQNQDEEDSGQARMTLLLHLKMSGQLVFEDGKRPALPDASRGRFIGGHPTDDMLGTMPNSHTRVIFSFVGGSHLYFNDQRKFGWVKVVQSSELVVDGGEKILGKLGPEPLEKSFTWQILKQNLLRHKNMPVKVAIMDQSVVSGVGNIYSSESCFNAKIDPRTKVGGMSDKEFRNFYKGIIKALQDGIKYGGSTRVHFVDSEGHKGYFLDYAFVYGRDKHSCRVCGTEIKKISIGGRGTYFCPHCQK